MSGQTGALRNITVKGSTLVEYILYTIRQHKKDSKSHLTTDECVQIYNTLYLFSVSLLCCNASGYAPTCENFKNYTQLTYTMESVADSMVIRSKRKYIIHEAIANHRTEEK